MPLRLSCETGDLICLGILPGSQPHDRLSHLTDAVLPNLTAHDAILPELTAQIL